MVNFGLVGRLKLSIIVNNFLNKFINVKILNIFGLRIVFVRKFFSCCSFLGVMENLMIFFMRFLFFLRGKWWIKVFKKYFVLYICVVGIYFFREFRYLVFIVRIILLFLICWIDVD